MMFTKSKDADGKTYLAPVIDDVVKEINVNDGYVLIVPMKGIFDDEDFRQRMRPLMFFLDIAI